MPLGKMLSKGSKSWMIYEEEIFSRRRSYKKKTLTIKTSDTQACFVEAYIWVFQELTPTKKTEEDTKNCFRSQRCTKGSDAAIEHETRCSPK